MRSIEDSPIGGHGLGFPDWRCSIGEMEDRIGEFEKNKKLSMSNKYLKC
jgi:hypothetical protein